MDGSIPTRERIYRYILAYQEEHHYPPSLRDICRAVGIKSTSTVHGHIKRMIRDGVITQTNGCPRTIWANPGQDCSARR